MTRFLLLIATTSCFIRFASAAHARSAYDGAWELAFVTQRGNCDSSYSFTVDVKRNYHPSQPRETSRSRRKFRFGARFGHGPGQICFGCGQTHR
jgi:putative salt-induced outer membrane protein YdiY